METIGRHLVLVVPVAVVQRPALEDLRAAQEPLVKAIMVALVCRQTHIMQVVVEVLEVLAAMAQQAPE